MQEGSRLPSYELPDDDPIWWMGVDETLYDYSYRFARAEGLDHWQAMHIALECVTVG
jgi:hypothetical protein